MNVHGSLMGRRFVNAFGKIIVLASIGFLAVLLWRQRDIVLSWRPDVMAFSVLLFSIVFYAMASILLVKAWRELLLWTGEVDVGKGDALRIYGRSQIAKYIPGNVAQLVGRHIIGRQLGWSHTGLVIASTLELVSLLLVASIIAFAGLSLTGVVVDLMSLPMLAVLAAGLVLGTVILLQVGPHAIKNRWPDIAERLHRCSTTGLWRAVLLHLIFFGVSGMIFLLIGFVVLDEFFAPSLWPGVLGLVAFAWIIGIITPGSPSGIGVREGVLVITLASVTSTGEMLLLVGLFRLVTLLGDVLFFFVSTGYMDDGIAPVD